ncbi:MAG: hypothetical protein A3I66_05075 [Burkholderiales bacterium RIFCSPLOWO2_02_FULL_57_36]|nr:MAG: hypothetical protein A3I66_05075 [Burkholderiales bacterium RIFCSPLOWO2_02_FULL_57_36]
MPDQLTEQPAKRTPGRIARGRPAAAAPESHPIDRYLLFAFGVIFLSVLLWLVFREEQLNEDKAKLVHLVSSLAAAGVGAALPGWLNIEYKNFVRAGGALGLFVLVFTYQPERAVNQNIWPPSDAGKAVESHLEAIDKSAYASAYKRLAPEAIKRFSKDDFLLTFANYRAPLGEVESRQLGGIQGIAMLPDGTKGPFKVYSYITKFESGKTMNEVVWAMTVSNREWRVIFHNIFPCPGNECSFPLENKPSLPNVPLETPANAPPVKESVTNQNGSKKE